MQRHLEVALLLAVFACAASVSSTSAATIGASVDFTKPSQITNYNLGGGEFHITENVALDSTAGPWIKNLTNNTGSGIASGANRMIIELLTNLGSVSWFDWHEQINSRTTINAPNDAPGFLFRNGSLSLQANYGSGFVNLVQGVDYTVVTTPYSGPPDPGNNGHFESINIFLVPARVIAPGNVFRIQKDIFEVFGDADPWQPGTSAQISQYPTPEPTGWGMCVLVGAATVIARRGRHVQRV